MPSRKAIRILRNQVGQHVGKLLVQKQPVKVVGAGLLCAGCKDRVHEVGQTHALGVRHLDFAVAEVLLEVLGRPFAQRGPGGHRITNDDRTAGAQIVLQEGLVRQVARMNYFDGARLGRGGRLAMRIAHPGVVECLGDDGSHGRSPWNRPILEDGLSVCCDKL